MVRLSPLAALPTTRRCRLILPAQTYSGVISGTGNLTDMGGGALTLGGANTFSGTTTVSNGQLVLANSGTLQGSVFNSNGPGTLAFGTTAATLGGLYGSGSLTLRNTAAAPVALSVGANNGSTTYSGAISGPGSMIKTGTGADPYRRQLVYRRHNHQRRHAATGQWKHGSDGSLSAAGGINDNAMLTYNLAGAETYSGVISGSGRLTKTGSGTLTLNQVNTFTGLTTINVGTIILANSGALQGSTLVVPTSSAASSIFSSSVAGSAFTLGGLSGAGTLTMSNDAGVDIALTVGANSLSSTYNGSLVDSTGNGSLIKVGTGSLMLGGANTYGGLTTVSGGTLVLPSASNLPSQDLLSVNPGATLTLLGATWAAEDISNLLGSSGVSFAAGSTLAIDTTGVTGNFEYDTAISGTMNLAKLGPGTLVLTQANNLNTGLVTISGGTLQLGTGASGDDGSFSGTAGMINNGTLAYNLYGSQTYAGVISGSGNLTKTGSGALTLGAANTYTGTTTITTGAIVLANSGALQASTVITKTGGQLVFSSSVAGNAFTLGALSGSGTMSLQNNATPAAAIALTVGGDNATTTYSGRLSGSGSLTKVGSGTMTLNGMNTYNGATIVSGGALVVASSGALAGYGNTGTLTVNNNATLTVDVGGAAGWQSNSFATLLTANGGGFGIGSTLGIDTTNGVFVSGSIGGNMGVTKLGSNSLTLTGASTFAGPTVISGGTLQFGDGTTDGSLTGTAGIVDNAMLLYKLVGPQTYSGVISGSGNLTKTGSGVLTLAAANIFSGSTTFTGTTPTPGTLVLANSGALQGSTVVTSTAGSIVFCADRRQRI